MAFGVSLENKVGQGRGHRVQWVVLVACTRIWRKQVQSTWPSRKHVTQLPWLRMTSNTFCSSFSILAVFLALTLEASIRPETSGEDIVLVLVHHCSLSKSCCLMSCVQAHFSLLSYLSTWKERLPDLSFCGLRTMDCGFSVLREVFN